MKEKKFEKFSNQKKTKTKIISFFFQTISKLANRLLQCVCTLHNTVVSLFSVFRLVTNFQGHSIIIINMHASIGSKVI